MILCEEITAGVSEMANFNEGEYRGNGWDTVNQRSGNASYAIEAGRCPLKYWEKMKKEEILQWIKKEIDEMGGPETVHFSIDLMKKAQKKVLIDLFLETVGEWHHMKATLNGKRFAHAKVAFYHVSRSVISSMTDELLKAEIAKVRKDNTEKYAKAKVIRQANKTKELEARKNNPLVVGYFTKPVNFQGKVFNWNNDYIGVVDGSRLYYYDFPKFDKNVATQDRSGNLNSLKIRWTAWPGYGKKFKTFAACVKKYPQFKNKKEEIKRLMKNRKEDRAEKEI